MDAFSPWFAHDVLPRHVGLYEVLFAGRNPLLPNGKWHFDGRVWRDAEGRERELWPGDRWRGLAAQGQD